VQNAETDPAKEEDVGVRGYVFFVSPLFQFLKVTK